MHVHMQLFQDGQPIFYDENGYGQLSDMGSSAACWKHTASLYASLHQLPTSVWSPALRLNHRRLAMANPERFVVRIPACEISQK